MALRRNSTRRNPSKAVYIGTGLVAAAAVLYFMMKKDETTTTTDSDGTTITTAADGTVTAVAVDGTTTVTAPDGATVAVTPDGTRTETTPDGTQTTTTPDGATTTTRAGDPKKTGRNQAAVAEVVVVYLDGSRNTVSAAEANSLAASGYFIFNAMKTALTERATSSATGAGFSYTRPRKEPKKSDKVTYYYDNAGTARASQISREEARGLVEAGSAMWNATRTAVTAVSLLQKSASASTSGRGMSY